MPWFFAVVEREHELQNPTSVEKIVLLGERLRLGPRSHVLDVASGRGGPAILLAQRFGCRLTCVERSEDFHAAAQQRVRDAGVGDLVELVLGDALAFPLGPARYDAALCLGATFVWGGLDETLAALAPAVRSGGFVAVGEPYWRVWPLPQGYDPGSGYDFLTMHETVARVAAAGLRPTGLICSSLDDWDRYETLHWLAADEWLREQPDDPEAAAIRARVDADREHYLRYQRDLLGWAILVGRTR
jgi:SAM-dependent methyltransferase